MFYYLAVAWLLAGDPVIQMSIPAGNLHQCEVLKQTTAERHVSAMTVQASCLPHPPAGFAVQDHAS